MVTRCTWPENVTAKPIPLHTTIKFSESPLCRLNLGTGKNFIGIFNELKKEVKSEITTLDDIYKFSDALLKTIDSYDKQLSLS